ncbi:MAG: bifunctional diaminohydroxyphosphoribosylaminopyrimidine deaminase/5-amino-6-(5-phosphoribosylamino)uracil reductase RibD [Bacteroidota bacterium]
MNNHETYIKRCLELAKKGFGAVAPNPMVGSVIVYDQKIIGEGYHEIYGQAHAEVNAINSVENKELLKHSTLYVNLEPCSHFGKTPPCADLIVKHKIPNVVIGSIDSNSAVSGRGIKKLTDAGINVTIGVLEKECKELNKRFFTFHEKKRPYIILKWAQTADGFIDKERSTENPGMALQISNTESRKLLHLWRSQEQAIMVGTNTALLDNPKLTVRELTGTNPLRITIDKYLQLPEHIYLFDKSTPTIVFTAIDKASVNNLEFIKIDFEQPVIKQITSELYKRDIQSIIIEGGQKFLNSFINEEIWDEARIFVSNINITNGVKSPILKKEPDAIENIDGDQLLHYTNKNL